MYVQKIIFLKINNGTNAENFSSIVATFASQSERVSSKSPASAFATGRG
jgi:hypothetical protein